MRLLLKNPISEPKRRLPILGMLRWLGLLKNFALTVKEQEELHSRFRLLLVSFRLKLLVLSVQVFEKFIKKMENRLEMVV